MKKTVYISGAVSSSLIIIGGILKILHLPFAGPCLILGLAGLALVFIPTFAVYLYKKGK